MVDSQDTNLSIVETAKAFEPYLGIAFVRTSMRPTIAQQQAIQAKLNFMLGPDVYDRVFLGFTCGGIDDYTVSVFVDNEDVAGIINTEYSWHIAVIVESILKTPIRFVNALPKDFLNSQAR